MSILHRIRFLIGARIRSGMPKDGATLIAEERRRQLEVEGFAPEHDAVHYKCELAFMACYYAVPGPIMLRDRNGFSSMNVSFSPYLLFRQTDWHPMWAKRESKSRIRQLTVAGALIAAEIDRLQVLGKDGE